MQPRSVWGATETTKRTAAIRAAADAPAEETASWEPAGIPRGPLSDRTLCTQTGNAEWTQISVRSLLAFVNLQLLFAKQRNPERDKKG